MPPMIFSEATMQVLIARQMRKLATELEARHPEYAFRRSVQSLIAALKEDKKRRPG